MTEIYDKAFEFSNVACGPGDLRTTDKTFLTE